MSKILSQTVTTTATTASTIWTTTTSSKIETPSARSYSPEEFLSIEDRDLQKYLYTNGVGTTNKNKIIDNDEKYGVYHTIIGVRQNNRGVFYKHSKLQEYIVYNKKTKKVTFSNMRSMVFNHLMREKFGMVDLLLITGLFTNPTKTLCKKIIEGKIDTIGDLVQYHISYTIRDKTVTKGTAAKFLSCYSPNSIHLFENPNEIAQEEHFEKIVDEIPIGLTQTKAFLVKKEDIPNLNSKYNDWCREQGNKYAAFRRDRDGKASDSDESISSY